ncbi:MAG: PHB depolymerase family esterase [Burkholderiales bacterium]
MKLKASLLYLAMCLVLLVRLPATAAPVPLPSYNVDPAQVSVSGFSAGAFMAQQLGVAYSSRFMGVGVLAGGFYDCRRGANCLRSTADSIANMNAWSGSLVDPVSEIARQRIYVFIGTNDAVIGPARTDLVVSLYKNFVPSSNIRYENTVRAAHIFATDFDAPGNDPCLTPQGSYIGNCGFDSAGAVLQWIYGSLHPRNTGILGGNLIEFNQGAFAPSGIGMDTAGWIFVPASCAAGQRCRLHVALHGSGMGYSEMSGGAAFINNTGYNLWADTNDTIVLYPQGIPDPAHGNSYSSWDFNGDYGANYDQHGGVQIEAIMRMVAQIAGGEAHVVVEYYNASLDHYFITWIPAEIAILDAGTQIRGWTRTGYSFKTYTTSQTGTSPVCRYYIPPGLGDSHFFGRGTVECNATGQKNPSFVLEDPAFMQMFLPTAGVCPANSAQIYRVFSNRPDANHRYMTDKAVRDAMVAKGWLAEGDGPDLVVMCAPQ